jgi:hypothetical protein
VVVGGGRSGYGETGGRGVRRGVMSTWKDRAQAALEEERAEARRKEEAENAKQQCEMSAFLQDWLHNMVGVDMEVSTLDVNVDGVHFRARLADYGPKPEWH